MSGPCCEVELEGKRTRLVFGREVLGRNDATSASVAPKTDRFGCVISAVATARSAAGSKRLPDHLRHPEPPHPYDLRRDALVPERLLRKHGELQRDLRYGSNWVQSGPPTLLLAAGCQ